MSTVDGVCERLAGPRADGDHQRVVGQHLLRGGAEHTPVAVNRDDAVLHEVNVQLAGEPRERQLASERGRTNGSSTAIGWYAKSRGAHERQPDAAAGQSVQCQGALQRCHPTARDDDFEWLCGRLVSVAGLRPSMPPR